MNLEELKFPIGKYQVTETITNNELQQYINTISSFPNSIKNEVANLKDHQLDTPYRPDGWTIRQVIHHCADSHMNSLIRLKLALTENEPTIKPYLEAAWAELVDSKTIPITASLNIIDGVHQRWNALLNSMTNEQFERKLIHPEFGIKYRLDEFTGFYAWHCNHHLAHITTLKTKLDWE